MSWTKVLTVCVLFGAVLGDPRFRLLPLSVPLHYDVELTIDVDAKSFVLREWIKFHHLQDFHRFDFNWMGPEVDWLNSSYVVSDTGKVFRPNRWLFTDERNAISLRFEETLPGNANYTVFMENVTGLFGSGLLEIPMSSPGDDESSSNYLLTTGHNRTNMRYLFPCYDDPGYRATYDFTIYHKEGYQLITNANTTIREGPIADRNNFIRNQFKIEEPMPTNSIAFLLTNMESLSSDDDRVRVFHEDPAVAEILLDNYHHLLLAVEEELGLPLELPKLDIVYNPSLPYDTLTKWGIVSVGPTLRPVNGSVFHSIELKDIQKEIARSVYQLFFGHYVHAEWWRSEWFTLGLARYFSGTTTHLPFDAEREFVVDVVQSHIREHDIFRSESMTRVHQSVDEINTPNLFIIDQRAAALMRLIAHVMGEDNFRTAILDFLAQNRFKSVTDEEFRLHLDGYSEKAVLPEGNTLSAVVHEYARSASSHHMIFVTMEHGDRYGLRPTTNVQIPVDMKTPSISPANEPIFWLSRGFVVLQDVEPESWLVLNPDQFGLYTVLYPSDIYASYAEQLLVNPEAFNRGQLISESATLVRTSFTSIGNYLNLLRFLPNETDALTWRAARISYEQTLLAMRGYTGDMDPFFEYFNSLAGDLYLENSLRGEMENFELTMELAKIVCSAGHEACMTDVEELFDSDVQFGGVNGSSDFQTFVYCSLARNANNTEMLVDHAVQLWTLDRRVNSPSRNAIRGLACSSNETAIIMFLEFAATDLMLVDHGIELTTLERFFILDTFLRGSLESVVLSINFVRDHFQLILDRLQTHLMTELFSLFRYFVSTNEILDALDDILSDNRMDWQLSSAISSERRFGRLSMVNYQGSLFVEFPRWVENEMRGEANTTEGQDLYKGL